MEKEKILGYSIEEEIGSGSFGTVYKVSKTNPSGTYTRALKHIVVPTQKQYADVLNSMGGDYSKADNYFAGVLKEIINEIQIISSLSEKGINNVVRYYENDIKETSSPKRYDIYILMEYLSSLPDYVMRNTMKVADVIKLGKDILTALVSIHKEGIIHRDIKDDNIFVSNDGTFKLGDFGVSKKLQDRMMAESVRGTPNYIAPEVYLNKGEYDNTVDLYSLGIVLYKFLNHNRNPFLPEFPATFNSEDENEAFIKRMKEEKPSLPGDAKNILGECIVKAISKRAERYDNAEEFLSALKDAEQKLSNEELNKVVNVASVLNNNEKAEFLSKTENDETIGVQASSNTFERRKNDTKDEDLFVTMKNNVVKKDWTADKEMEPVKIDKKGSENYQSNLSVGYTGEKKRKPLWLFYMTPVLLAIAFLIFVLIVGVKYGSSLSLYLFLHGFGLSHLFMAFGQGFRIIGMSFGNIGKYPAVFIIFCALLIAFVVSLICLRITVNKRKNTRNVNAIVYREQPYLISNEIYLRAKKTESLSTKETLKKLRHVVEDLKSDNTFGYNDDVVTKYENNVYQILKEIEKNVDNMFDQRTCKISCENIDDYCSQIEDIMKVRNEYLKKNA